MLKRLQPRLYSISSTPLTDPARVSLTVSVVRFGAGRKGSARRSWPTRRGRCRCSCSGRRTSGRRPTRPPR
ncbi:hypothetical protein [Paractinoplanes durhamensis]|uniref:hypothetical protein n=1 Tax=Paractinoplanes durhamensis TaxID=113563 RepID=UPI00363104BF